MEERKTEGQVEQVESEEKEGGKDGARKEERKRDGQIKENTFVGEKGRWRKRRKRGR